MSLISNLSNKNLTERDKGVAGGVATYDDTYTKTETDSLVTGLLDDRGNYDASVNTFPATGGSGTAGAIKKGDLWYISVAGTLGGATVSVGDTIRALTDTPAQTASNWSIMGVAGSYIPQSDKGAVSGVVPLDETGLIPTQYIPQSAIASNVVDFYLDGVNILGITDNNVNEVDRLLSSPISSTEVIDTIVVNNNTVLKEIYKCTTVLPSTTISAGTWEWITYASASSATGTTEILANIYSHYAPTGTISITGTGTTRTVIASTDAPFATTKINVGGTIDSNSYLETSVGFYRIISRVSDTEVTISVPTGYTNQTTVAYRVYKRLFQMTTGDINATTITLIPTIYSVQSEFTVEVDSCIAIGIFGKTTRTSDTNIQYTHNGTSRYTHFHSPLLTTDYFIPLTQKGAIGGVATIDSSNYIVQNIGNNITKYTETLTDLGTVNSGTVTLDCSVSRNWKLTVGGAVTLAFSNVPAGAFVTPLTLRITMPVAYTITYPASVKWNYGVIPALSTTKKNKLTFVTSDDGTTFDSGKAGEY